MYFIQTISCRGEYGALRLSEDAATVVELLCQKAYREEMPESSLFRFCHNARDCGLNQDEDGVPVGSVDFCEAFLSKAIKPINIPECLWDTMYTGRQVAVIPGDKLRQTFAAWSARELFVKSATKAKTDYTGVYTPFETLPTDDQFFVSTVIDVETEWRCFVWNGRILDIRRYRGKYTDQLSRHDLRHMENAVIAVNAQLGQTMPAYTVDFGRAEKNSLPVVIEVHNFIACGLYGFADEAILPMLKAGVQTERMR